MNGETAPEVVSQRTKQEGSAAPERSAAAPRTGAPNARNVAPGRTYRCGARHTFNALAHSGFDGASARSRSSSARAGARGRFVARPLESHTGRKVLALVSVTRPGLRSKK